MGLIMEQAYKDNMIAMVKQSSSPLILLDEKLDVLACSIPFYQSVIGFHDDIHSLFNANAIQRIKRARKTATPMKIKTETSPFVLFMSINWLPTNTGTPYMLGIVESNLFHNANRSLAVAYSCVERSQKALKDLRDHLLWIKNEHVVSDELSENMLYYADVLMRNHKNLLNSVDLLTDDLVMKKTVIDLMRIIRVCITRAQEKIKKRNIKIITTHSQDDCLIECDKNHIISALCECLYCILYFTQDNHYIKIMTTIENGQCHVIFTDPLYKIPDTYLDRIFLDDVIIPGSHDHAGLYFANAIIRKHGGILEIDNSLPLGYQIKVTLPMGMKQRILFEDYDDSRILSQLIHQIDMELFDL